MANDLPAQHSRADFGAVKGTPHSPDTYESGMAPNHPTLKPETNYKERGGAGSDVPIPPELPNPQGR